MKDENYEEFLSEMEEELQDSSDTELDPLMVNLRGGLDWNLGAAAVDCPFPIGSGAYGMWRSAWNEAESDWREWVEQNQYNLPEAEMR